jgi:hypothetical protein
MNGRNNNEAIRSNELCALYYPETICLDDAELKYLLLLYDKIYFLPIDVRLNPGHTKLSKRFSMNDAVLAGSYKTKKDAHYAIMYASEPDCWDDYLKRLMELYDELEETNVLTGLEDSAYSDPNNWHPLKSAVEADMTDIEFVNLCIKRRNLKVFVPQIEKSIIKGKGFGTRPPIFRDERSIPSICSERLNSTLFIAGEKKLIPSCGSEMYIDLLRMKLKRMAQYPVEYKVPSSGDHKISMLSWEVATEVVPRIVIQKKSAREIMKYKSACIDLKAKFRSYIQSLETNVISEPWAEKFKKEMEDLVKKEIIPEVGRIREQKIEIWEKMFGETLKTAIKVAPALVGIHLVPGISIWQILALSTSVVSGAVLKPLADAWAEERKMRRNSLFFLLRLK